MLLQSTKILFNGNYTMLDLKLLKSDIGPNLSSFACNLTRVPEERISVLQIKHYHNQTFLIKQFHETAEELQICSQKCSLIFS